MPLVSVEVILRHTLLVLMAISTTDTPSGSLNLRAPYGYLIGYFKLLYTCVSVIQDNWRGFGPNCWCFVTENLKKKSLLDPVLDHKNTTLTQSIVLLENVVVAKLANSLFSLYSTRGSVSFFFFSSSSSSSSSSFSSFSSFSSCSFSSSSP